MHTERIVTGTVPDQTANRTRVGMECKEHGLLARPKKLAPARIAYRLVVLACVLNFEQVNHVDEPDLDTERTKHVRCGKRLKRRNITAGTDYEVGILKRAGSRCPIPGGGSCGKLSARLVHRLERRSRLFATENGVHAVGRLVAALGNGKRHIRVRRIICIDDMRLVCLVEEQIDKAGILMREAVVVLTPHMTRQQDVETADRRAPRNLSHSSLEPFAVLVDHRIDHMDKALVRTPHTRTPGEHVALEKPFALVLGKLLDYLARARKQLIVIRVCIIAGIPLFFCHVVCSLQTIGRRLIWAEDAEVVHVSGEHVGSIGAEYARGLGGAPPMPLFRNGDFVLVDVGQNELATDLASVGIGVGTDAQLTRGHKRSHLGANGALGSKELFGFIRLQPAAQHAEMLVRIFGACQRHLMRAPRALGLFTVDMLGARPALGRTEHNHRVRRTCHALPRLGLRDRFGLDAADFIEYLLEQCGKTGVDARM